MRALIEAGADVGVAAPGTPLLIAAHQGHAAVVRALIEAGADVGVGRREATVHRRRIWPRGGSAGADGGGCGRQQGNG